MQIFWMKTHEVNPELGWPPDQDFSAFDGKECIGRVYRINAAGQGGPAGMWKWSMTALKAGPRPAELRTSGIAETRGEAGRRVVEAYRAWIVDAPEA